MLQEERERASAMAQARLLKRRHLVQRSRKCDGRDYIPSELHVGEGVKPGGPRNRQRAKGDQAEGPPGRVIG